MNQFTVTPHMEVSQITNDEAQRIMKGHSILLYGMKIEGAVWDTEQEILVDSKSLVNSHPFPVVEVEVCQLPDDPNDQYPQYT